MSSAKPLDELRRRLGNAPAPGAFAALAEEHRRAGRLDEAVAVCREGLARYPTYVSARVTLGRALLDVGDTQAAIEELEQAVAQAPDNLAAVRALESARTLAADDPDALPGTSGTAGALASDPEPALTPGADTSPDADDTSASAPSGLSWLTAGDAPAAWPATATDPHDAAGGAPGSEPTAWDETIYAPIRPFPMDDQPSDPADAPSTSDDPAAIATDAVIVVDADVEAGEWSAEGPTSWFHREATSPLGDDVIAFPAFREDAVAPPDPLAAWVGFADAPAQSDVAEWDASVDAVVDEVFDRAGQVTTPALDDVPALEADAVETAAVLPEPSASPLQALEALLAAIRERRAALGYGRADVD